MRKEELINKWVSCVEFYYKDSHQTIDNSNLVHPDDHEIIKNKSTFTYYKCVSIEKEYIKVKSSSVSLRIKPEAVKRVYPDPKFEFGYVVQYNSSKKGRLILVISRLEWHLKEQVFYYYADHSGKQYKKRLSGEELTFFDVQKLSKTISHALRHEPQVYGLELLEGGWVLQEDLIKSLASFNSDWENIDTNLLQVVIDNSIKKRHEIKAEFIREKYGHTANVKLDFTPTTPPSILFHGTSREMSKLILKEGLKPMDRHYVHSSHLMEEAMRVGKRKDAKPVILIIDAQAAAELAVNFYPGNDKIWLSEMIPSEFLKQHE